MLFPTRVGVFPRPSRMLSASVGLPHAGGGVSNRLIALKARLPSSPRGWGCFRGYPDRRALTRSSPRGWGRFPRIVNPRKSGSVFPTRVGVFPIQRILMRGSSGLPHAGGGVSQRIPPKIGKYVVFPTRVGVFPSDLGRNGSRESLPHAGGGVSLHRSGESVARVSSPRGWGCFRADLYPHLLEGVFPTRVGVFLPLTLHFPAWASLPHAGGGVSETLATGATFDRSSPRRWGCFLQRIVG